MATNNFSACLPPRPPTPPKDFSSSDPIIPVKESLAKTSSAVFLETPETPTSSLTDYFSGVHQDSGGTGSRGTKRKRVNFILTPTHHSHRDSDPPSSPPSLPKISPQSQRPPLRVRHPNHTPLLKPAKSILKAPKGLLSSDVTAGSDDLFQFVFKSPLTFKSDKIKMIESICLQLESSDKSIRLDAYRRLFNILKDNGDVTGLEVYKARESSLMSFLLRDLQSSGGDDHRDGQIGIEVLKVSSHLAARNAIREPTSTSLIDWVISQLLLPKPSKGLINNALMLLTCTRSNGIFLDPLKPDRAARTERLFDALKNIHLRVQGKNILLLRLDVYKRLVLIGHKSIFTGARFWLRHMFEALVAGTKDLFEHALSLGKAAAIRYGDRKEISRSLVNVLQEPPYSSFTPVQSVDRAPEDGSDVVIAVKPFIQYLVSRLLYLLDPEHGHSEMVPQIWSLVVCMMRHNSTNIRRWDGWAHWLTLLQRCFNSSDTQVKILANTAWKDLIWASQDRIHREDAIRKGLFRPILSQLERKESDKPKSAAESALCTFLYYTFQPRIEDDLITSIWEDYVAKALVVREDDRCADPKFSARVLLSLLGNEESKVWNKDRLLFTEELGPEALIRLDPRWVCANTDPVLAVLDGHLRLLVSGSSEPLHGGVDRKVDIYLKVWLRLVASIAEAGRREVRPSNMSIRATLSLLDFVLKLPSKSRNEDASYGLALQLIDILLNHAESLPLNQRCFSREGSTISVKTSFSAIGMSPNTSLQSALDLVIDFLAPNCLSGWAKSTSASHFSKAIGIKLRSLSSRHASLAELSNISSHCVCSHAVGKTGSEREGPHACQRGFLWNEVSYKFNAILSQTLDDIIDSEKTRGQELEYGVMLLVNGIGHIEISSKDWTVLLLKLSKEALSISGNYGLILAVISPIASALTGIKSIGAADSSLFTAGLSSYYLRLLSIFSLPGDHVEVNLAWQKLWGHSTPQSNSGKHALAPVLDLFVYCLSSDNYALRTSATNAWRKIQDISEKVDVPEHLLAKLQEAQKLADVQSKKTSTLDLSQATINLSEENSQDLTPEGSLERQVTDSPSRQLSDARSESVMQDLSMIRSGTTPQKLHLSATIENVAHDELSSSPPEYYPRTISFAHLTSPDAEAEVAIDKVSPLPAFLSVDEPQRQDDSPTPVSRRPSRSQSEAVFAQPSSPSLKRSIRGLNLNSDPTSTLSGDDAEATPSKKRAKKSKKSKKRDKNKKLRAMTMPLEFAANVSNNHSDATALALEAQLGVLHRPQEGCSYGEATTKGDRNLVTNKQASSPLNYQRHMGNDESTHHGVVVERPVSHAEVSDPPVLDIVSPLKRRSSRQATKKSSQCLAKPSGNTTKLTEVEDDSLIHNVPIGSDKRKQTKKGKSNQRNPGQANGVGGSSSTKIVDNDSGIEDCIIVGGSKTFQAPQKPSKHVLRMPKPLASPSDQALHGEKIFSHGSVDRAALSTSPLGTEGFAGSKDKRDRHKRKRDDGSVAFERSTQKKNQESRNNDENDQMTLNTQAKIDVSEKQLPRPSKKSKMTANNNLLQTPEKRNSGAFNSPVAGLSEAARAILTRLKGLLEDMQSVVLGRTEAREVHRALGQLSATTCDAEERGDP